LEAYITPGKDSRRIVTDAPALALEVGQDSSSLSTVLESGPSPKPIGLYCFLKLILRVIFILSEPQMLSPHWFEPQGREDLPVVLRPMMKH
jgi:hypothetical protein